MLLSIRENYLKTKRKNSLRSALCALALSFSLLPAVAQKKSVLRAIPPIQEKAAKKVEKEIPAPIAPISKTSAIVKPTEVDKPATKIKSTKTSQTASAKKTRKLSSGFVPPPPPNTPSILSGSLPGLYPSSLNPGLMGLELEYLSPAALKEKYEEINSLYKHSLLELERKKSSGEAKKERAAEFADLYKEGVISLRELETAQKDAEVDTAELEMKCKDEKRVLDLLQNKIKEKDKRTKPAGSQEKKHRINKLSPGK